MKNFHIEIIKGNDARVMTQGIQDLKKLIISHEELYPNIDRWFAKKVIPGIKATERIAYIGYLDNKPVASAIVKKGRETKFCHLHLNKEIQDMHLGEIFFVLMANAVRDIADEIHFTLPESLWLNEKDFFNSFGFNNFTPAKNQYRLFEEELKCSAPFSRVWDAALAKFPKISNICSIGGYSMDNKILMSLRPEFAKRIINGSKRVEIRRKFAKKWIGYNVCLYSSRGASALVGEAKIEMIDHGSPEYIWERYNNDIGSTYDEFLQYVGSSKEIYAIVLTDVKPYKESVPISQLSHILSNELTPPQSYYLLDNNEKWSQAVSIAALLHASFPFGFDSLENQIKTL
jgi:predicted transcriptional regulator